MVVEVPVDPTTPEAAVEARNVGEGVEEVPGAAAGAAAGTGCSSSTTVSTIVGIRAMVRQR